MLTGMTSVTFRELSVDEIIDVTKKAGLDGIEWAGDVHVPPNSYELALEVAEKCRKKGIKVLSYGSYYRGGPIEEFQAVLNTAKGLGAPMIRIWAGRRITPDTITDADFEKLCEHIRRAAALAAEAGIALSFEYHRNTITQTKEGALRLLQSVPMENVYTYWQPNPDITFTEQLAEIDAILPRLSYFHVFAWEKDNIRFPLSHSIEKWQAYFEHAANIPFARAAILEFVKDDSIEQFMEDAKTLKSLVI